MKRLQGKMALVTGASSGIGAAITRKLAEEGASLALIGRDQTRLENIAADVKGKAGAVFLYIADLAVQSDRASLKFAIDDEIGRLDILVHSAGTHDQGLVEDVSPDVFIHQLQVNTVAPYALTHFFLPNLRRRRGQIVFINSRAALFSRAGMSQYCASKHALKAFADSLRQEVDKDGIRVISVYPGRTATPMQQRIHEAAGHAYDPTLFPQPESIADLVVHALTLPDTTEISDVIIAPQQEP